jgi:Mor family transcriptional regulator
MARITKSQLVKLQKQLKRDAAIGAKFGITRQAVHQLRKKYGVSSVIEENPVRNKDIIKLYQNGKAVATIAKKFDLSISYTYRIISEAKSGRKKGSKKRR